MIHTYIGIAYYKNKVNWTFYMTFNQLKSFFLEQRQAMSSSGFIPKINPLIDRPDMSANHRPVFWRETTLTHVLTRISEKTDFSP